MHALTVGRPLAGMTFRFGQPTHLVTCRASGKPLMTKATEKCNGIRCEPPLIKVEHLSKPDHMFTPSEAN
jgi:hypothetical protein